MKALQHSLPYWGTDSDGEERYLWPGFMRSVSAKRARKLRKRGVPLMSLHATYLVEWPTRRTALYEAPCTPGRPGKKTARYAWFTEGKSC